MNAQYRFVMNPTGDYTVHFADPDIFFQWHDILQVIIPRTSAMAAASSRGESMSQEEGFTTCPICLAPPTAPRMTKCGHVFCFPCILHLLGTAENKWVRCPVCFDSVNEKHLKAVKWLDEPSVIDDSEEKVAESSSSTTAHEPNTFSPGSRLRMRLMQRPQITTLALPRSTTWPSDLIPPHQAPFHFLPDVFEFAKFMLATPDQLLADLSRDLEEVAAERRTLFSLKDELALVFVDVAEEKLRHQLEKAAALDGEPLKEAVEKAMIMQQKLERDTLQKITSRRREDNTSNHREEVPNAFLSSQSEPLGSPQAPGRNQRQRRNVNPPPPSTQTYYYYQAASGLPIFLHPLDIKVLLSHFNSYLAFPDDITVRVEARSEGTVNDDLRKRWKYLGHLPEGADVVFIEADLEGVVGAGGLVNFEGALKQRRARRKEKGKKDDKAKARAEEREKERFAQSLSQNSFTSQIRIDPSAANFSPGPEESAASLPPANVPTPSGAWGNRSFASLLQTPAPSNSRPRQPQPTRTSELDEYEFDAAWHELEQVNNRGGKRRKQKMIVLGGGGGGSRRR